MSENKTRIVEWGWIVERKVRSVKKDDQGNTEETVFVSYLQPDFTYGDSINGAIRCARDEDAAALAVKAGGWTLLRRCQWVDGVVRYSEVSKTYRGELQNA